MKVTIEQASEIIKNGGIAAMPTETVYGLAADAANLDAIRKTFRIKGRPQDNPLIVHISDIKQLDQLADNIPDDARILAKQYWPGPLTLVLKKKNTVLDAVTAGLDTVAVRMPDHKLALDLISRTGPVTAPSANLSGKPSPTRPEHLTEDYGDTVPYIDGGKTQIGIESTVLDMTGKPYSVLRPGSVGRNEISDLLQQPVELKNDPDNLRKSPGTRYSHYKPSAAVRWLKNDEEIITDNNTLYILHTGRYKKKNGNNIHHLKGDYDEFARVLYDLFRIADKHKFSDVAVEPIPGSDRNPVQDALFNRISKAVE